MNERHLRANVELDEEFAATCEELDAHDAKLLYVFHPLVRLSRVPVFPIPDYDHLNPLPLTPLAKLMLPIGDNGLHHVDVYIQTVVEVVDTVRAAFHKLTGRAGTLIPRRLEKNLDQYLPPNSKARARGRWLAWMAWLAEGQPIMLQFTDDAEGGYWMGTIDEPFQCCRDLLQVLRAPEVNKSYSELGEFKCRMVLNSAAGGGKRKSRRRQAVLDKVVPLTPLQIEALQHYGELKSYTKVGKQMGIGRKAATQHITVAYEKMGQKVPTKPRQRALPNDGRGQPNVAEDPEGGATIIRNSRKSKPISGD